MTGFISNTIIAIRKLKQSKTGRMCNLFKCDCK